MEIIHTLLLNEKQQPSHWSHGQEICTIRYYKHPRLGCTGNADCTKTKNTTRIRSAQRWGLEQEERQDRGKIRQEIYELPMLQKRWGLRLLQSNRTRGRQRSPWTGHEEFSHAEVWGCNPTVSL